MSGCKIRRLSLLATCLSLLAVTQASAETISFTLYVNGLPVTPIVQSGATPNSAFVDVVSLNSVLSGMGSAYQFTTLSATSNFPGTAQNAFLTLSGSVFTFPAGSLTPIFIADRLDGFS